jgi:hypothetical protein
MLLVGGARHGKRNRGSVVQKCRLPLMMKGSGIRTPTVELFIGAKPLGRNVLIHCCKFGIVKSVSVLESSQWQTTPTTTGYVLSHRPLMCIDKATWRRTYVGSWYAVCWAYMSTCVLRAESCAAETVTAMSEPFCSFTDVRACINSFPVCGAPLKSAQFHVHVKGVVLSS